MATVLDHIKGALRLVGALADGEAPLPEISADAHTAFNEWLDADSINRDSVYALQDQTFTWAANDQSVTFGGTGADHSGTRPILVDKSTYYYDSTASLSFPPIRQITVEEYNNIANKTMTSTYPDVVWINMTYPYITLTQWPVATRALVWHIMSVLQLTQPTTLTTSLSVPPGYLLYFRYSLAVHLAAEFGVEPLPSVLRIAADARRSIKRINKPDMRMHLPLELQPIARHDIISGI